ncbi:ABC transporter ATP-binding protein [Cytobacillus sp. FSL K6-0265]|uniref:ABC transporter ATP-binding protein n=1 Tax=Cytobacillus sp. FSL K6-0265 TaxID=2921448 RepID=UPI0030F89825
MENTKFSIKSVIKSFINWKEIWIILFKANRKYFFTILTLTILSGLFPAAIILATEQLINFIQYSIQIGEFETSILFSIFGVFAFLTFISGISNLVLNVFQSNYQNLLVKEINLKIIEKSVTLPYQYFEDSEIYDMIQRARVGAASKPYQIFDSMINGSRSLISLLSVIGILISWKWWTIFLLLLIPLLSTTSLLKVGNLFFQVNYRRVKEQRKQNYYQNILTMDRYVKEVKLFNLSNFITERFKLLQDKFYEQDKKLFFKRFRTELLFTALSLFIVVYLHYLIINETFNGLIAIGSLVAYFQAVNRAQSSSQELVGTLFNIYQNNLYVNQLFKFLQLNIENNEQEKIKTLGNYKEGKNLVENCSNSTLEFKNVFFKYPGNTDYTLKDLNFIIEKGESIALVGENGCGKSTIIKLITRLYTPTKGDILYNGISISEIPIKSWSDMLGAVFQDYIPYEFPVWENIGFGDLSKINNIKLIENAANNSGAHSFIEKLPKGYETQLGKWFDDGIQLSGGQWQRIAIARAYMKEAQIFLLDEPAAALDPLSEMDVFNKLRELSKGKISIFITHRYSTVRHANKIIFIDGGEIKECGTHAELIELQGSYSKLYNTQIQNYFSKQPL